MAVEYVLLILDLRSELESSPGAGIEGSLRFMFIATCDRLRSDVVRSRRGDPRLPDDLRSVALIEAAAASE